MRSAAVAVTLLGTMTGWAADGDWLRWGGPHGNFVSDTTGLAARWAPGEPKTLWERDLGDGYSAILAKGDVLYTMTRRGGEEVVVALEADTGKTRWELSYDAPLPEIDKSYGIGPRGTPTLEGKHLYTAGIGGIVHCIDIESRKSVWSHDLKGEYGATMPNWGYSSSPLVYGDLVLVACGGQGSVIAFNKKDGSEAWKAGELENSYSSPMLINVSGQDQVVIFLAEEVVGLDPKSGQQLWSHPHTTSWNINATMPVWSPETGILMISSAYGSGARGLKLTRADGKTSVSEAWAQRRVGVQHGVMILDGTTVYCSVGMQGPAIFAAVDLPSGEILWKQRGIAKATMVQAGPQLVVLGEDGTLHLVRADREGFEVLGEREILGSRAWTVPTLVGTRLYARDMRKILALELPE